jgi:predicted transposase YbfD/YdcC
MAPAPLSLPDCFRDLEDPRREHQRLHALWDILVITICAVLSSADSWVEVARYGRSKEDWLRTILDLEGGIPSHDTFNRVFALLDPHALQNGFRRWMEALCEASHGRLIAIDGKTLRHSFDSADGKGPLHLVGAWAGENNLLLGQRATDAKSNEITAIPELLAMLDLKGAIVTIDAMGCQTAIAERIHAAGADYVLSLKENQPTLFADVRDLFLDGLENDFADLRHQSSTTHDTAHGRRETRVYRVVAIPPELAAAHDDWAGLRSVGMVYSERQVGEAEATGETRFFLSSLAPNVETFARAVRGHWSIENSLHWILDIAFREDESRLRKDHGPENLGLLRRWAVSLLKNEKTSKEGIACKRKRAGWDNDYLLKVLAVLLAGDSLEM